jgi:hypothetical protein
MAELVLLSLNRNWFVAVSRAAEKGDQAALDEIKSVWSKYENVEEIPCFVCDAPVTQWPPFMQVCPAYKSTTELIGCPLCSRCQSLPTQVRWAKVMRMWKRIWSERYKKNVTFHRTPHQQPHPR